MEAAGAASPPNSGSTVVKFRFAVGRSKKNEQGGWDKDPNQLYIDCEVFSRPDSKRNLADLVTKYAKQGDLMYIEGRLVFEEWEDKNGGGKRSKHKLVVDSLEFLGGRNDAGGAKRGRQVAVATGRWWRHARPVAGAAPPPDSSPEDFGGRRRRFERGAAAIPSRSECSGPVSTRCPSRET